MPKSRALNHMPNCLVTGKVKFPSEEDAIIALGRIATENGTEMEHYLCKHCKFYHLARMKRRKKHAVEGTGREGS